MAHAPLLPPDRLLPFLAGATLATFLSPAQTPVELDLDVARSAFAQVRAIAAEDGGALWGLSLDFPVILIDPSTRECVASHPDTEGGLVETEGVWTGTFPDDEAVANATTSWAGRRWTMLVWPVPAEPAARARILLHESFHNAQHELGLFAGGNERCDHLGTFDGRLWLRLEARALARALESEGFEREDAVIDALTFRAMRRSLFPELASAEDSLERLEGAAEYTGIELGAPDRATRLRVAAETLRGLATRPSLVRSFPYGTGPALGLLLDELDPYWRESFLAGASFTELITPVFASVLESEADALADDARRRAKAYGWDELVAEETEREARRRERLAAHRARYVEGPVLVLPAGDLQRSFDPSRIEALDDVGAVYGVLWAAGDWGILDAPGGALVRTDDEVRVPAPASVTGEELSGDGWTLRLAEGWTVVAGERQGDWRAARRGD